ncbi:DUF6332 family protein [Streptomyces sp. NPDC003691]
MQSDRFRDGARAERPGRTRAERDAVTVEIGYALASAVFAAAVVFGAVAGPALLFPLSEGFEDALRAIGRAAAVLVFVVRVATVLWRFAPVRDRAGRREGGRPDGTGPGPGGQPSQPGRTRPDS